MPKYKVTITATDVRTIELIVDADYAEDAEEIARDKYENEDLDYTSETLDLEVYAEPHRQPTE